MIGTQECDLLILDLDLDLPKLSGLDVLRRLRARASLLPVLILTAADSIEQRVHGLDLGADDYRRNRLCCPNWRHACVR